MRSPGKAGAYHVKAAGRNRDTAEHACETRYIPVRGAALGAVQGPATHIWSGRSAAW